MSYIFVKDTTGTVTSVGLSLPTAVFDITVSPVTGSGTLTAVFDAQLNNTFFAGPTTTGSAVPTFRALDPSDFPAFDAGEILFGTGTGVTTDDLLFWDNTTKQLGVGTSTFTANEREKVAGNLITPAPDAPTTPIVSITYGGGGYVAGGFTHEYQIYSRELVNEKYFYSPTFLSAGPITDNGSSVTPDNVTGANGTINYGSGGYTANGDTHSIDVYSYVTRSSGTAYSLVSSFANVTDDGSTNPYNIDWAWDAATIADGYILVNENAFFIDVGNVITFNDDNTLWVNTGFVNTPNSVTDDYVVNVSWTAPGSPPTGYLVTVQDDYTPKAFDYYFTNTSPAITDSNDASSPTPVLTGTSYADIALDVTGNINFQGRILGTDQFLPNNLIIGQNINSFGENIVTLGVANAYQGIGSNTAVFGTGNTVGVQPTQTTIVGHANNFTATSPQYSTIVGYANSNTGDAIYSNVFGYTNAVTARLTSVMGQSNSVAAQRATTIGIANTIGSLAEHGFAGGYQNNVTASEGTAIGYQSTASGIGATAIGYGCTASGAVAGAYGAQSTASGNHAIACGYGSSASSTDSYSFGFSCGASAFISMALGINAQATVTGQIAFNATQTTGQTTTLSIQGQSTGSGTGIRNILDLASAWATSTNASRKGRMVFNIYDTAAREAMRLEASGSAAMIGFLGASAIVRPVNTVAINDVLVNLGLRASGGTSNFSTNIDISALNIITDTTTGTKIGTGTTQKLGFFNATPIVQPANTVAINDVLVNLGLRASGGVSNFTTNIDVSTVNIVTDTSTGTKIGTGTTQKLAFYNSTPVVQPANSAAIDTLLVTLGIRATGGVALFDTDVKIGVVGNGIYVKEGSNATMGTATLSGGTIVVSTTKVTANSRIFLTINGGTLTNVGAVYVSARTAGTSFTISSLNILDASNVGWIIFEPS